MMRAIAIFLGACVFFVTGAAYAFRTTRDLPEAPLVTNAVRWPDGAPQIFLNELGSQDISNEDALASISTAFGTWSAAACADVHVTVAGTTTADLATDDGVSVIAWRENGWADLGYSPAQIAVTHMEYVHNSATEWSLSGGDIALNGQNFAWVLEGGMPGTEFVDLQTLLTHEGGHFLGLQHPCEVGGADGAPACTNLMPPTAPTMTPGYFGQLGRTLEEDDVDGICFLYPAAPGHDAGLPSADAGEVQDAASDASTPSSPPTPSGCGCAVATTNSPGLHANALLFAGLCILIARMLRKRHGIH